MAQLERILLPQLEHDQRRNIYILYGLGGIGKTQLAVEFARRHHNQFSSVFWLDGRNEYILKHSIASCANRIPKGQIAETSRTYTTDSEANIDMVIKDVLAWLALPNNTTWLLIFDNVEREYAMQDNDPEAYDIRRFLPDADHGSVLVTTRLAQLNHMGESQKLGRVSLEQGQAILESWYKENHSTAESEQFLAKLGGLPLAVAQAGAYLQESGVGLAKYLDIYERQWSKLMEPDHSADTPLLDYPNRSVWTTWIISYQAIASKHSHTANLLLLWSLLNYEDLWHGLFAEACTLSNVAAELLSNHVGSIAISEISFSRAMRLLSNYSLVEKATDTSSYAIHPVVHRWVHQCVLNIHGRQFSDELVKLAAVVVGFAVPNDSTPNWFIKSQRLLPHAQMCLRRIVEDKVHPWFTCDNTGEEKALIHAINGLCCLFTLQGKLNEAKEILEWMLRALEESFGPTDISTLRTVKNLGTIYHKQGMLCEAEKMYERVLQEEEKIFGLEHPSTLQTICYLGNLFMVQGRLDDAKQMLERALQGHEMILGPQQTSTLQTVHNLGTLHMAQGILDDAEQMVERALRGYEEALGPNHTSTLQTVNDLDLVYRDQARLEEAEQMCERALRGYDEVFGSDGIQQHLPALDTMQNLGDVYARQGEGVKALEMYSRALSGLVSIFGQSDDRCIRLASKIDKMSAGKKQEELFGAGHFPSARIQRDGISHRSVSELTGTEIRRPIFRIEEEETYEPSIASIGGETSTVQQDQQKKSSRLSIRERIKKAFR